MKAKTERSTLSYEPESVTKEVTIEFNKITRTDNTIVGGDIKKSGSSVGSVGRVDYNKSNDTLTVYVKPASSLTDAEKSALFKKVPECLKDILAD